MMVTKARAFTMLLALWFGIIVFWLMFFAFERPAYFEIVNASVVALAVGVDVGFHRGAWRVLKTDPSEHTAGDILVLGIFVVWSGIIMAFLCLWAYRLTGDIWWLSGWLAALSRWIILLGGVLHLSAAGAIDGKVPARAYIRAGVIVGLSVAAALFLVSWGID